MTVLEDVATFLRKRRPKAYCDDCLGVALVKDRHHIQKKTQHLASTGAFNRDPGGCVGCDHPTKLAIRAT